jgi:hypothetical protein
MRKTLLIVMAVALPLLAAGIFYGGLTLVQIATPANPASGSNKLYFKSDDKLYKLTSAGTETEIGAGGGSSFDCTDPANLCLSEEFMGGSTTSGSPVGNHANSASAPRAT